MSRDLELPGYGLERKVDDSCVVERDAHHRVSDACGRAHDVAERRQECWALIERPHVVPEDRKLLDACMARFTTIGAHSHLSVVVLFVGGNSFRSDP